MVAGDGLDSHLLIFASVSAGFKVPAGRAITPSATPASTGDAAADAGEEGMPKEDPSKLERAPGEENEEV